MSRKEERRSDETKGSTEVITKNLETPLD